VLFNGERLLPLSLSPQGSQRGDPCGLFDRRGSAPDRRKEPTSDVVTGLPRHVDADAVRVSRTESLRIPIAHSVHGDVVAFAVATVSPKTRVAFAWSLGGMCGVSTNKRHTVKPLPCKALRRVWRLWRLFSTLIS